MRGTLGIIGVSFASTLAMMALSCGGKEFAGDSSGAGGESGTAGASGTAGGGEGGARSQGGSGAAPATGGRTGGGTGGTGGGTPISSSPIALEDLPVTLADAYCPTLASCCNDAGIPLGEDQCRTTFEELLSRSLEGANPDNYSYDPALAGECVALAREAIQSSECAADLGQNDVLCRDVFGGMIAPGEPCSGNVECAQEIPGDETSCEEGGPDGTLLCTIERRVGLGDPCYWSCRTELGGIQICSGSSSVGDPFVQGECFESDGLFCGGSGLCEKQGMLGQMCSGDDSCVDGTFCDFTTDLCALPVEQGEGCSSDSGCQDGLYCKSQQCVPELEPGAPCEILDECRGGSCENGVCVEGLFGDVSNSGIALTCAFLTGLLFAP